MNEHPSHYSEPVPDAYEVLDNLRETAPQLAPARYATSGDLFGAAASLEAVDLLLQSGLTVRVRPISRKANLELGKGDPGVPTMEARLLAAGVVEPRMSVDGWLDWIGKAPTAQVAEISNEVRRLSGIGEGADKSGV